MRIEEGQIVTLENNKEYLILKKVEFNNNIYVYLITAQKPIEVLFMKEVVSGDSTTLLPIDNNELADIIPLFEK